MYEVHHKKDEALTTTPLIHIYINIINDRLVFKTKDEYKLELHTSKTMKLFGSVKRLIDKTEKGKNLLSLEVVKVVLVQYLNNQATVQSTKFKMFYTFTPNKSYVYLLNVGQSNLVFFNNCNTEFDPITIIFNDGNGRPLEKEDKINLTLLVIEIARYFKEPRTRKCAKRCGFLSLSRNTRNSPGNMVKYCYKNMTRYCKNSY